MVAVVDTDGQPVPSMDSIVLNSLGSYVLATAADKVLFATGLSAEKAKARLHRTTLSNSVDPVWENSDAQKIANVTAIAADELNRVYIAGNPVDDTSFHTQ